MRSLHKYDVKRKYPMAVCKIEKFEKDGQEYRHYVLRAETGGEVLATDWFAAGRVWRKAWETKLTTGGP